MEFKLCLIFVLVAFGMMSMTSSISHSTWGLDHFKYVSKKNVIGNFIGNDNEMLMESESSRRALVGRTFIGPGALQANQVPCGQRGQSYYNCQNREVVNPYNRGCTAITNCARYTD